MATITSELKTYYQRDWEEILPKTPLWETVGSLAGFTLPFVSLLYKPAGKVISLGSTALSALVLVRQHKTKNLEYGFVVVKKKEEGWTFVPVININEESWTPVHIWSVIKNGTEFIGTIASVRIGLAVHTVLNLGEHSYRLVSEFKTSTWSKTGEKMLPVVSNALYLLTLVSFSTPVACGTIVASLMFQAGLSCYKTLNAYEKAFPWNSGERVKTAVYGSMTVIYLAKAGLAIRQCST